MCISRRHLEQLRRPEQLTRGWSGPDAFSQQFAKPRSCTQLLGEGVTCRTQIPKCTSECFKKRCRVAKKKKKRILRWEEVAIPGNIHLCPLCYSWNEEIWCIRVLLQRNVLHTLLHCLLHVGSVTHVIDCSCWPEASTRLTSACNYWPPLIVSQRCRAMSAPAHLYVTYIRLIGFFHLFLVLPDTARRGK